MVINVVDHDLGWEPPSEEECAEWTSLGGLEHTVVLRELGSFFQFQTLTSQAYGGDHYTLLLLDRAKQVRLRWGNFWNEADLAPAIDAILAEP